MKRYSRALIAGLTVATLGFSGLALAVNCPGPDNFGKGCSSPPDCGTVALTPIPGAIIDFGVAGLLSDDQCVAIQTTGGPVYSHYGTTSDTLGVAMNGYLLINGCTANSTEFVNDCPVPDTLTPNGAIYGHWDDLTPSNPGGNIVVTLQTDPAGDVVFVETATNIPPFSGSGTVNFEIQVWESTGGQDGQVDVVLSSLTGTALNDATTGVEDGSGIEGLLGPNSAPACDPVPPAPQCTRYEQAGGGGTCDLTPIEAKLDILEPKVDVVDTVVDALEVKLDSIEPKIDQSNNSLDALEVKVDALDVSPIEAKLDMLEPKFDDAQTRAAAIAASLCEITRLLHSPQGQRSTAQCGGYTWNGKNTQP